MGVRHRDCLHHPTYRGESTHHVGDATNGRAAGRQPQSQWEEVEPMSQAAASAATDGGWRRVATAGGGWQRVAAPVAKKWGRG